MNIQTIPSSFFSRRAARWWLLAALVVVVALLAGCDKTGQMADQAKFKPLQDTTFFADSRSARSLVPGTVSYAGNNVSPNSPTLTGLDDSGKPVAKLPVTVDVPLVQLGYERYNIYCIPCHGPAGEGNGKVTGFGFPKPPSLLADDAKALSDGEIFQVIEMGKGKMFPYGYRVKPDERWAVVAYLRAMQIKNGKVALTDITPDLINQIGK